MVWGASAYRYGDLLALARRSWVLAMARELGRRGYGDYRITDAAVLRHLLAGPLSIGQLGAALGVTRQAARKVARGLEERELATSAADPDDARKHMVVLSESGTAYAHAVVEVIDWLNRELAARVDPAALAATDAVLRATITDRDLQRSAGRIPDPSGRWTDRPS